MNLHQIELFVAVVEAGSFSRAAELYSLTQSTVSQHIAALESEAGTILLDRTAKGAVPTEGGRLLLHHARRVLNEFQVLQQALAGFRGLNQAALTIGASNVPTNYLVPALLPLLAKHYPGITLSVKTGDSQETLDRLAAAEVELAVVGVNPDDRRFTFLPLVEDRLVLTVDAGHRWAGRSEIRLDELAGEPLILRESGSGSAMALRQALQRAGLAEERLAVVARLGSNESVRQAVTRGFGVAFLSEVSIQRELARGELVTVRVDGLRVDRHLWLVTRNGASLSPAAEAVAGLLEELCRKKLFAAGPSVI